MKMARGGVLADLDPGDATWMSTDSKVLRNRWKYVKSKKSMEIWLEGVWKLYRRLV
jgi:hypothetical protein